ncbi:MAG: histidine kinase [Gammaproteobacteria bacterium]|nr:histidine kinase [Gammaproteobacteria bacterium]MBU0770913.1 histidine kinase [Gammaproteobacteria bacterium]MBU0856805.1 histidine kinase [Gammaproteobacteria bacterium]MBU1845513.1 histidine kinase [Gammaproteobacteria bacterium]
MRPARTPDWRNLGVMLRSGLLVNALAALGLLARNRSWDTLLLDALEMAARIEPTLLLSLLVLYALQPTFRRLPVRAGWALVALVALLCAVVVEGLGGWQIEDMRAWPLREAVWAVFAALAAMIYFTVQERALGPAIAQARLMALSARIRPHFLFNSLNAVLGIMRDDPRRAERALEELSDLFRVLMRENRELVTLGEELALCRQYIELEKLRLGERLGVVWQTDGCPPDARVPPLMLQPLLENAVYHGVEPLAGAGEVRVSVKRVGGNVMVEIDNPAPPREGRISAHGSGNRMAVDNIRERLMLFFDLEAQLDAGEQDGMYRVRIRFPYRAAVA